MASMAHSPVIIIGAGISGLGTAIQLLRLQSFSSFEIYEKADSVGGTWFPHNPQQLTLGGTILIVPSPFELKS
jgi:cation diffusion facilitator CzcD-associated flavoprotein CzcO